MIKEIGLTEDELELSYEMVNIMKVGPYVDETNCQYIKINAFPKLIKSEILKKHRLTMEGEKIAISIIKKIKKFIKEK
jgi:hypothetical protein